MIRSSAPGVLSRYRAKRTPKSSSRGSRKRHPRLRHKSLAAAVDPGGIRRAVVWIPHLVEIVKFKAQSQPVRAQVVALKFCANAGVAFQQIVVVAGQRQS